MNYLQAAKKLQQEGKFPEAIALYRKGIEANPSFSWYYHHLGECLAKIGNLDEAIASYKQALELNPNSALSYYQLGENQGKKGLLDEGIANIEKAIKLKPNFDKAYNQLGQLLTRKGLLDSATVAYQKSIEINPQSPKAYFYLGTVLAKQKKWAEAETAYQKAISINPALFESNYNLAIALEKQGKLPEAIACYQIAIEIDPKIVAARQRLGNVLKRAGRLHRAVLSYKEVLKIEPQRIEVHRQLGNTFKQLNNLKEAINSYSRLIELEPNQADNYCKLGVTLAKNKQFSRAIACYLEAIKIAPNYKQTYQNLGDILTKLDRKEAASACYDRNLNEELLKQLKLWAGEEDWEVISVKETNKNFSRIDIHPLSETVLSPPKTLEAKIHDRFTDEKLISPETFVAVIPEGRVWLYKLGFVAITRENQLIEELSRRKNYPEDLIMSSVKMPPLFKIDGTVAAILGHQNYFTWICQVIPIIELLRRSGIKMEAIDKFAIPTSDKSFQKQTLNLLGIPPEKILSLTQHHHIQASKLIVPSTLVTQNPTHTRIPEWSYEFLRKEFLAGKDLENIPKKKRLYISRSKAELRRVVNEKEVMEFLSQYGFERVILESLPVVEQASLMAEAEAIISPHGAGLTNAIFCSPGTKIIEIFSPMYVVKTYWIISDRCNLDYYYMMGEKNFNDPQAKRLAKLPFDQKCRFKNIYIGIDYLKKTMEFAGLI